MWKDITNYVLPRRSFWDLDSTPGQKPASKIYDGTAIAALQLLVDGLQGYLVSPRVSWFRLVMEDRQAQMLPGAADYLEDLENILLAEFSRSNLYESMGEFFLDAASLGTAVQFVEDDVASGKINFTTRHLKECYIAENRYGKVDTVYRVYPMTNTQVLDAWPKGLDPQRIERSKEEPYGIAKVMHCCYPMGADKWASVYIDKDFNKELDVGSFEGFPYNVWRWRKNSDEVYGRGPAADALQDILRVNQAAKSILEAAQLANEPPLNVPEAMKGHERIVPRGFNYYSNPDEIIRPINLASNYPIGKDQENEMREQIREIFRTRIFLLMEQLESGSYTATEIRERQGEKAAVLGATIGRLNSECLVPLIERAFAICERNRIIPPPPPSLSSGGRIKIEFQGPLAQAQKQYHQGQGVTAALQFAAPFTQINPEALDNVDFDELMRAGLDALGSPQRAIREVDGVQQIREARAKAQQAQAVAQQQMMQDQMVTQNAAKLNLPVKDKSMLQSVLANKADEARQQKKQPAPTGKRAGG
jgi:hypothetical protein